MIRQFLAPQNIYQSTAPIALRTFLFIITKSSNPNEFEAVLYLPLRSLPLTQHPTRHTNFHDVGPTPTHNHPSPRSSLNTPSDTTPLSSHNTSPKTHDTTHRETRSFNLPYDLRRSRGQPKHRQGEAWNMWWVGPGLIGALVCGLLVGQQVNNWRQAEKSKRAREYKWDIGL